MNRLVPQPSSVEDKPLVVKYMQLRKKVEEYLTFLDNGPLGVSYEDRQFMRRQHLAELRALASQRSGSTMMEVMVALALTLIGVVSVLSIFPISVARSINAHNLTQATDLRYTAEAMIDLYPYLVYNPSYKDAAYHVGENYIVDPLGWIQASGDAVHQPLYGTANRYNGGLTTLTAADKIFTSPDTDDPRQYTYLLTVRNQNYKGSGYYGGDVDVVTFRNRSGVWIDEQPYTATFIAGSNLVTIDPAMQPFKGKYILDCDNCRWYRMSAVYTDKVVLELAAIATSPISGGHAVAPHGIIAVYPVGVKAYRIGETP